MGKLLLFLCLTFTAFAGSSQTYQNHAWRWVGTNLCDFTRLFGNTNFVVSGKVAEYYEGSGKAWAHVTMDYVYYKFVPKPVEYDGDDGNMLTAASLVQDRVLNPSIYYMTDPLVRRFIEVVHTNTNVVLLNCPAEFSRVGSAIGVYAWPVGVKEYQTDRGEAVRIPTFDHGRFFSTNADVRPAFYYQLAAGSMVKKLFPTNRVVAIAGVK